MPNPASAVVFRSNYEIATQLLSAYMQTVVDRAKQRGFNVVDLEGADATQMNFFNALDANDPLLVVAGGHGNETTFHGQNDELILQACTNDEVMSGREGIFNSCSVGVALGPSMVSKTAQWFAGWRADYIFMYQENVDPLQDEVARPFMECIIQPALTRLDGGGASQVYSATIAKFNTEIAKLWGSVDPTASEMITYLIHDRDNFMVSGVYAPVVATLSNPLVLVGGALVVAHFIFGFP